MNRDGLCECGCGNPAPISPITDPKRGYVKGQPRRFIVGHNRARWKGGRHIRCDGYVYVLRHGHPNADCAGYVAEHVLVASEAMGKALPPGAIVHHVNGVKSDNRPCNLVACNDSSYHSLLHVRARALAECGNANMRQCNLCKEWDHPDAMTLTKQRNIYHSRCLADLSRRRRLRARIGRGTLAASLFLPALLAGCSVLRPSEAAISVSNLTDDVIYAASAIGCDGGPTRVFSAPIQPGKSARIVVSEGCWDVYAHQERFYAYARVNAKDGHRMDVRVRPLQKVEVGQ